LGDQPYYHVAFFVRDFDAAKAELTRILRIEWEQRAKRDLQVKEARPSSRERSRRSVYSLNGPPFIELLEREDLPEDEPFRFAHLGYFDDDLPTAVDSLERKGLEREQSVLASDGQFDLFALLRSPATGLYLEIVNPAQSVHS
jgi:hypothetical protein